MSTELIWSKALEVNKHAIKCGAVIPLQTYNCKSIDKLCDYELRYLQGKIPKYLLESGPKVNPFIPWDRHLEIQPVYDYLTLILNKSLFEIGSIQNYSCPLISDIF